MSDKHERDGEYGQYPCETSGELFLYWCEACQMGYLDIDGEEKS